MNVEYPTIQYLNENGVLVKDCTCLIPENELVKGYQTMVLTRYVDERMITLQRQGIITFALSSLGEEACSVASAAALDFNDWMYPQYRESGVMFWRGFTIAQYVHHMFGDAQDLMKGRQMPNHFGSKALNVVTVSSPIGTKIPHAAGSAYAMKLLKEKTITICYFGEGATSEGDFHTGLRFAAVRKVPSIFFCRNNGYAISTPTHLQFATDGVAPEGFGHGVTTYRVDGNDFFAIYETVKKSRAQCLEGKGPILIEAMTYRMGAHSTSDDPSRYRSEQEVEKWRKKDPILRLRKYLESKSLWDQKHEDDWLEKIKKETDEAIDKAKSTPKPALHSIVEDVYFEVPKNLEEQFHELKKFFSDRKDHE